MFLRTAAIIGASVMILSSLATIPHAWKSRGTRTGALWIGFIVVGATIGVSVIAHQTGLLLDASYSTISLILVPAYLAVRVGMLKTRKADSRGS